MNEAKLTTIFLKWSLSNIKESYTAEFKFSKNKRLSFSAVQPHQERALIKSSKGTLNHKISDYSPERKPFDAFQVHKVHSYLIIFWYFKKGDRLATLIPINKWLAFKKDSDLRFRSITYDEACDLGWLVEFK